MPDVLVISSGIFRKWNVSPDKAGRLYYRRPRKEIRRLDMIHTFTVRSLNVDDTIFNILIWLAIEWSNFDQAAVK